MNGVQVAQKRIDSGQWKETQGNNRGPCIDRLEAKFGLEGQPWCAMFAWDCIDEAAQANAAAKIGNGVPLIKTAGSQAMLAWFKEKGWTSTNAQDLNHWHGALAIRTDPGGLHGHVVMVKGRMVDVNGTVHAVLTCEGNTNANGARDGDGAYNHTRGIPLQPYVWTFCDTSGISGGRWW
jgi:hypothetical protein